MMTRLTGRRASPSAALSLAALPLLLLACGGPDVSEPDVIRFEGEDHDPGEGPVADVRVEVRNFVDDEVDVEDIVAAIRDGRLSAQFRLVNDSEEAMRLEVEWTWLDADGIALRAAAGGRDVQDLVLSPGEEHVLTRTSPRPGAVRVSAAVRDAGPEHR